MTKEQLIKRGKAFLWGMFNTAWIAGALASLNYAIEIVPTMGLSEFATVTIVMLANQITKQLNKK